MSSILKVENRNRNRIIYFGFKNLGSVTIRLVSIVKPKKIKMKKHISTWINKAILIKKTNYIIQVLVTNLKINIIWKCAIKFIIQITSKCQKSSQVKWANARGKSSSSRWWSFIECVSWIPTRVSVKQLVTNVPDYQHM